MASTRDLVLEMVREKLASDLDKEAVFGALARGAAKVFGKGSKPVKWLGTRHAEMKKGGVRGLMKTEIGKSPVAKAVKTTVGAAQQTGKAVNSKWGRRVLVGGGLIGLGAAGVGAAGAAKQIATQPHAPPGVYPPGY